MGLPFLGGVSAMPGIPPTPRVSGFAKKVLHKDFASESEKKVLHKDFASESEKKVLWFKIKGEK